MDGKVLDIYSIRTLYIEYSSALYPLVGPLLHSSIMQHTPAPGFHWEGKTSHH